MNRNSFVLLRCSVLALAGLPSALIAAPPAKDYELLYQDDFSGSGLNENDWIYRVGRRTGPNMNGLNRKENVTVSGGELHIAVRQEPIDGQLENTGGGIISRHQFGYGYYETLSKPFMTGHGAHSSFWQAGGAVGNNNLFEIDGYEIDSKSFMACHNLYNHIASKEYKEVPWVHRANVPFKLNPDGSYLCAYEYTPAGVVFYDQGNIVAKAEWPELTAAQVVLLTALNGTGKVDGQPGETTFQYFRYYAKDYPGVNLLPNGSFEYNQDKVNPNKPVAWQVKAVQPTNAIQVTAGDAYRDHYKLHLGHADKPFETLLQQSLEYLRNGDYELTARVRRSDGQSVAKIQVANFGGTELTAEIPATAQWSRVTIPHIPVANHNVTVAIAAQGEAGQWVELDDIRFQKPPLPGQTPLAMPFKTVGDPIWSLAITEPISFNGDGKFYFFDRNVGVGDAISVTLSLNPGRRLNTSPIARAPKTGEAGWAVLLTDAGQIVFRIGSVNHHQDVAVNADYPVAKPIRLACVYDHGQAKVYLNGSLKKTELVTAFNTQDATAAGRLGAVNDLYDAVGDVIMENKSALRSGGHRKFANYVGSLSQVRIYNHALSDQAVQDLVREAEVK